MTGPDMVSMVRGWITVELNTIASMMYMAANIIWNPMSLQEMVTWAITTGVGVTVIVYNIVNTVKALKHWEHPGGGKPAGTNVIAGLLKKRKPKAR